MTSATISECTFNDNKAYQGYALYIQRTRICDPNIIISNNHFSNDQGTTAHPNGGGIISSEVTNIDKNSIENNNDFTNSIEGLNHFIHVDEVGNLLPEPIQTPTESAT